MNTTDQLIAILGKDPAGVMMDFLGMNIKEFKEFLIEKGVQIKKDQYMLPKKTFVEVVYSYDKDADIHRMDPSYGLSYVGQFHENDQWIFDFSTCMCNIKYKVTIDEVTIIRFCDFLLPGDAFLIKNEILD